MNSNKEIINTLEKNIVLRQWQEGDEYDLVKYANNESVSKYLMDSFPFPYTHADAKQWICFAKQGIDACNLAIVLEGEVIGGIGVKKQIDVYRKSAELGFWLGEKHWNKGIMTIAVRQMIEIAFEKLNIIRLFANVFSDNKASASVLEKAGFELEGTLKSAIYKNGKTMDQLVYTIIR